MALKGSLKEAGLPDILQLLALGEKTGCLSVTDNQNFGHVFFRGGRVVYANLVNREDRLGERLLAERRVGDVELGAALAAQKEQPERRLGELLVERGALEVEELWRVVADQIEETIYVLFTWDRGYFHFEPGQEPPSSEILLSLDVSRLLLEGARRADEWARIRSLLPHRRLILGRAEDPATNGAGPRETIPGGAGDELEGAGAGATAGADHDAVLRAVDGARDVAGVLAAAGLDEFRGCQALHDLLADGRLAVVGESPPAADEGLRRRDEYRNLGLAFYRTRMYAEAAREFRQMTALDERDAEAHFHLGLVAFRDGRLADAREAFARVVELRPGAPAGYLDLALTLEAMGRPSEADVALETLLARVPDCAPARLQRAILRYSRGEHAEALALLEGLELEEPLKTIADFYRAMLHALFWDLRAARDLLEGIPTERQSARVLNNLGAVLERGDRLEEARLRYAAALDLGGAGATGRKNLGDLYHREGKYEQARRSYLLALQEDPYNAEALARLGELAAREGRRTEAAAYWRKAVESDASHERASRELAALAPGVA
ncbi:MAG: DUF4388 domain-containing protein [Gemmatimonadota bacterium]